MKPYIHILGRNIPSYSLTAIIGFIAVFFVLWLICRKRTDVDHTQLPHLAVAAVIGTAIGAHLLYGIVNFRVFLYALNDDFSRLHTVTDYTGFVVSLFGGMVFYGGLIGAIVGFYWYLKVMKLPSEPYWDLFALSIPLFHGFARIGCFLGGCCYGIESKYGFVYHHLIPDSANEVPRFPVQLLESGLNFVLFFILLIMLLKNIGIGRLFYFYLIAYSIIRFFDEFLRGDTIRGFVGVISTSQFISIIIFIAASGIFVARSIRNKQHTVKKEV